MSVFSEEYYAGPYLADGTQREFPFDFPVLDESHIVVYMDDEECLLDYSVDMDADRGGTVVFAEGAAPPAGVKIVILRNVPLTQLTDLQNASAFYPEILEMGYDKLTMIAQEIAEVVDRCLKLPPSFVGGEITGEDYTQQIRGEIADFKKFLGELDTLKKWIEEHAGERLQANYVEVTSLDANGNIYVDNASMPTMVQTNKGSCYPIEKGTLTDKGTHYSIRPNAYMAYDGVAEFTPPWRIWRAGGKAGTSGRGIFEVFYSLSGTPPTGAMDLSLGTLIGNCKTLYPDFYAEALKRKAEGTLRTLTETEYQAELAANGSCGAFVINETSGSMRLPSIKTSVVPGNPGAIVTNSTGGSKPAVGAKLYIQVFNAAPEVSLAQSANFVAAVEALSKEVTSLRNQVSELLEKGTGGSGESSVTANPVGTMIMFMGASAPLGYVLCDGRAVSRSTYSALFGVIGTLYGKGDGSTTFNLPDMRAQFPQGGTTPQLGTKKAAGLPAIKGTVSQQYLYAADGAYTFDNKGSYTGGLYAGNSPNTTQRLVFDAARCSDVYGKSNTVQPPALVVNYYIKY